MEPRWRGGAFGLEALVSQIAATRAESIAPEGPPTTALAWAGAISPATKRHRRSRGDAVPCRCFARAWR
ncbi:DUF6053 domain-containing protein [Lysobacter enzymogenes]|uniref:DUF6053 domain-containing protein n=1 Tax=Lysobacter enzymogenes TaxID=69 RepID=UPI003D1885A4